jgi:protein gp37
MAIHTDIEWADSTLNLMMGCDGCELWNPAAGVRHCYAGTLTGRYAGVNKGWPESFDKPKLFLDRLGPALRWPDLTGKSRLDKPWFDGYPRMIFLNDLGDSFTESLPLDWLAPLLPKIAASPHRWLLLTKRPKRMAEFSRAHPLPRNVWPGVSVTSAANVGRIVDLLAVKGGGVKWLSIEPLLGPVNPRSIPFNGFTIDALIPNCCPWSGMRDPCVHENACNGVSIVWAILGGESGADARPCQLEWMRELIWQCVPAGVPVFVKQLGSNVREAGLSGWPDSAPAGKRINLVGDGFGNYHVAGIRDRKGGDPEEWPEDLRIREVPKLT